MPDVLEVLKTELRFIEIGGYAMHTSWGPQLVFEDSPACTRYESKEGSSPCAGCVLMRFVPPERRSERIPCRHIPLNASGETLDNLYRYGNSREIEEAVGNWLRATIDQVESERKIS